MSGQNSLNTKILLLMIEPPLPFGNAASRWFYVLYKGLLERGHQVKAIATSRNQADKDKALQLFPPEDYDLSIYVVGKTQFLKRIKNFFRPFSFKVPFQLEQTLATMKLENYDIIHIEQLWGGWMIQNNPERSVINVHHLQKIDLENSAKKSLFSFYQYQRIKYAEKKLIKKFKFIRSCSPRLVEDMDNWNPRAYKKVVPVGIDHSLYNYIEDHERVQEPIITLIGTMRWFPSSSSARRLLDHLWPQIKQNVPDAKVQIVGRDARSVLKDYLALDRVEILENVPEIEPYFKAGSVFVYTPARGSGMKIKILEAMLFGIPVVTTSEGVEGLPVEDGVHAYVAEDDKTLIDKTSKLLQDVDLQNSFRKNARTLVETYCGPKKTVSEVEEIYQKILTSKEK